MERSKPKSAKTTYENRYKHKLNMLWPGQIMLKIVGVFLLMGIPFWLLKWRVFASVAFALVAVVFAVLLILVAIEILFSSTTFVMSNFKSTVNKYGDNKYRVDFSYISPDGKRHRTCKRGFKLQKDAVRWQREEMPKVIKQLEQVEILDENLTMGELISEYMEYSSARRRVTTCGTKGHII